VRPRGALVAVVALSQVKWRDRPQDNFTSYLKRTVNGTSRLQGLVCKHPDRQVPSLTQARSLPFPPALFPIVERLYIMNNGSFRPGSQDDDDSSEWLEQLLRPFIAVKSRMTALRSIYSCFSLGDRELIDRFDQFFTFLGIIYLAPAIFLTLVVLLPRNSPSISLTSPYSRLVYN
jgi:hypothetical protein